ncbi:MAG: TSUP family transporter, partial [Pseudomonadota bacterium]
MVIHGALQLVANGWRAYLIRGEIAWRVVARYTGGALLGIAGLLAVTWVPDKRQVYLILGLVALLVWIPRARLNLDIQRAGDAFSAGALVQGLNTIAGVAGPVLDVFFINTAMTPQQIVATKSITQALSHLVKIGFWSVPLILAEGASAFPPAWFFLAAIPIAMAGTWAGGRVLARVSAVNFRAWTRWLVTVIGAAMLARAAGVY